MISGGDPSEGRAVLNRFLIEEWLFKHSECSHISLVPLRLYLDLIAIVDAKKRGDGQQAEYGHHCEPG